MIRNLNRHRKAVLMGLLIGALFGCKNPKVVRKEVKDGGITVRWYFYSYITDGSPEKVEVEKDGEIPIVLYEAKDVVTDISVNDSIIKIRLFKPYRGIVYTKTVPEKVFGYRVVLDSSALEMTNPSQ